MARTKAMAGTKAGGKSTRKTPVLRTTPVPKSGGGSKGNKRKASNGARNSACKRPVPKWQLPIGEFLTKGGSSKEATAGAPPPEEEGDMEIVDVAPTTSAAACGSADTINSEDEAADNSIDEDADTTIEEEAGDTSIVEEEADTSIVKDVAVDTSTKEGTVDTSTKEGTVDTSTKEGTVDTSPK